MAMLFLGIQYSCRLVFVLREKCAFIWIDDKFGREELLSALGMIVEIDGCKIGK